MNSSNPNKFTIADVLANFGKRQAQVQQEKSLKDQLKQALMQNQAQELGQFVPGMQQQMPPQEEMSMEQAYQQAKRGGIHLDPAKKGTFKAQATRMGMSVQEAAAHILSNKNDYSPAMRRKANFARNFAKEEGGTINNPGFNALPKYVQGKILGKMSYGGNMESGSFGTPEEWVKYIKSVEAQLGNPASWTLSDYQLMQDTLNEYRNWRENTPEGQAVKDYKEFEGQYDVPLPQHLQDSTNAMMKSRLAYANEFGNPAAQRMVAPVDNPYMFDNGQVGTHYMASMDNYAVPQIQNQNGQLMLGDYDASSNEAMQFDNPADARYFAEHYKKVSPAFMNGNYRKGGEMIKRADGSYSQRGLWDNIRANKGSGRKPTREMIEQERKLRRKAMGGMMGPGDCPKGYEWDDVYQVCVPMEGTITPESLQTTEYMKNWYDKRAEILNDPNYINEITNPEIPKNTQYHINRLSNTIPIMQQQYAEHEEGQPLTPIEYTGPLANPDAVGEYIPDESGGIGSIRVRKDELLNPLKQQATMAHEWTTGLNAKLIEDEDQKKFYTKLLEENLISWDDFRDRAIDEGKVGAKDKPGLKMLEYDYDYSISPIEDNIHSNINVARQLFNLQPTDVIDEAKIDEMLKIAEQKGYLNKESPNFVDDIYRLSRLKKDNKSLANLFNLLASSGEGKNDVSGSDIQMAKYGGNIGKLRKFF
jgi:hypothetical protein